MLTTNAAVTTVDAKNIGQVAQPVAKAVGIKKTTTSEKPIGSSASATPKRMHWTCLRSSGTVTVCRLCVSAARQPTYQTAATASAKKMAYLSKSCCWRKWSSASEFGYVGRSWKLNRTLRYAVTRIASDA